MMKELKVLVSSNDLPERALEILRTHLTEHENLRRKWIIATGLRDWTTKLGFTVLQSKYSNFGEEGLKQNKEELLKLIPGCSALVWVSHNPITKELLDAAGPQLKIVSTVTADYNHCNIPELRARGIKLTNTPIVLDPSVAEIAVSLMLGAARRFTENLEQVNRGDWEIGFTKVLGQDIRGSTVGIVGLGRIGQAVVKRLAGFEVSKFIYTAHKEKREGKALNAEFVNLDALLAQSDFIVLAVPLNDETRFMINKTAIRKMKKNAILVNVSQGELIDQDALYDALKNHDIYAAGLDVTTPEPLPKGHKLLTLPNLFVLPHIGSASVYTRSDMAVLGADNVVNAFTGIPLITPVLTIPSTRITPADETNPNTTKELKVLVSSNDLPEPALEILRKHFTEHENLRRKWIIATEFRDLTTKLGFTVLQSKYSNFGKVGLKQNREELLKLIPGCSALLWVSHHPITKELLDAAGPQLKIVSTVTADYNHCNIPELRARGIKLTNTPIVLDSSVAEIVVSLMLGAAKRFTENLEQVHRGDWEIGFTKVLGQDILGTTVGIVGLGRIGQAVVKRLAGFDVSKFIYTGHKEKPEGKALNAEFVSLDALLAQSDFIVLAVPLNDETKLMINKTTIGKMKKNAILVNVGRGELVDLHALYDALKNRDIFAAGLDVTSPVPLPKDHKLLTLPNLFVLSHIGSATVLTRNKMAVLGADNIVNALTGIPLITPVLT